MELKSRRGKKPINVTLELRIPFHQEMATDLEEIAEKLHTKLFSTKIRETVALPEAQARQLDIFSYQKRGNAIEDYSSFIEEVLGDIE